MSEAQLLFADDDYYRGKAHGAAMDGDYLILKHTRNALTNA